MKEDRVFYSQYVLKHLQANRLLLVACGLALATLAVLIVLIICTIPIAHYNNTACKVYSGQPAYSINGSKCYPSDAHSHCRGPCVCQIQKAHYFEYHCLEYPPNFKPRVAYEEYSALIILGVALCITSLFFAGISACMTPKEKTSVHIV